MSDELKVCPFCGSACEVTKVAKLKRWSCSNHDCIGNNNIWYEEFEWDRGKEIWNTRYERTCKVLDSHTDGIDENIRYINLSCGHTVIMDEIPNYCPDCGCKVEQDG